MVNKLLTNFDYYKSFIFPEVTFDLEKILFGGIILLVTLYFLTRSEKFNFEIKRDYEDIFGWGSWRKNVYGYSVIGSLMGGFLAGYGAYIWSQNFYFYYFVSFGAVMGYIATQSILTDPSLHQVDRYMLRISYVITGFLTLLLILNSYQNMSAILAFAAPVLSTYLGLFILFLFSGIGASDIRAIVVFLPFLEAVHMPTAFISLVAVTVFITIFMTVKKVQTKNPRLAVPILPYLTVPYVIISPIIPLIVDLVRVMTI